MSDTLFGWVCPICKTVVSPYEKTCVNGCKKVVKKTYRINYLCTDLDTYINEKYKGIDKLYLDSLNYLSDEKSLTEKDCYTIKDLQKHYREIYKDKLGDNEQTIKLSLIAAVDYFKKHKSD
jgi:hypothetical protein